MLGAPVTSARATPTEVSGYSDTTTRRLAGMTPTIGDSSSMVTSWSLILCQPGTVDFTTASSITGIAHAIFILISDFRHVFGDVMGWWDVLDR